MRRTDNMSITHWDSFEWLRTCAKTLSVKNKRISENKSVYSRTTSNEHFSMPQQTSKEKKWDSGS